MEKRIKPMTFANLRDERHALSRKRDRFVVEQLKRKEKLEHRSYVIHTPHPKNGEKPKKVGNHEDSV